MSESEPIPSPRPEWSLALFKALQIERATRKDLDKYNKELRTIIKRLEKRGVDRPDLLRSVEILQDALARDDDGIDHPNG